MVVIPTPSMIPTIGEMSQLPDSGEANPLLRRLHVEMQEVPVVGIVAATAAATNGLVPVVDRDP